ncbi:hypothetical protein D3C76_613130 [compost metagenome]
MSVFSLTFTACVYSAYSEYFPTFMYVLYAGTGGVTVTVTSSTIPVFGDIAIAGAFATLSGTYVGFSCGGVTADSFIDIDDCLDFLPFES